VRSPFSASILVAPTNLPPSPVDVSVFSAASSSALFGPVQGQPIAFVFQPLYLLYAFSFSWPSVLKARGRSERGTRLHRHGFFGAGFLRRDDVLAPGADGRFDVTEFRSLIAPSFLPGSFSATYSHSAGDTVAFTAPASVVHTL